ncbi:MAG: type II toxin-antitoxin system HicA family toxin [Lachnospiraceae bacterium]|nr:type II toxin-antitoxin system HicA family toxin [Lachnospiraceae bacterium]
MTGKEAVSKLKKMGWTVERTRGSHCIMKKGNQTEVIPVHNTDIPTGLFQQIKKRTGLK